MDQVPHCVLPYEVRDEKKRRTRRNVRNSPGFCSRTIKRVSGNCSIERGLRVHVHIYRLRTHKKIYSKSLRTLRTIWRVQRRAKSTSKTPRLILSNRGPLEKHTIKAQMITVTSYVVSIKFKVRCIFLNFLVWFRIYNRRHSHTFSKHITNNKFIIIKKKINFLNFKNISMKAFLFLPTSLINLKKIYCTIRPRFHFLGILLVYIIFIINTIQTYFQLLLRNHGEPKLLQNLPNVILNAHLLYHISYHLTSYHLISYHIKSYHIISSYTYHIIYHMYCWKKIS